MSKKNGGSRKKKGQGNGKARQKPRLKKLFGPKSPGEPDDFDPTKPYGVDTSADANYSDPPEKREARARAEREPFEPSTEDIKRELNPEIKAMIEGQVALLDQLALKSGSRTTEYEANFIRLLTDAFAFEAGAHQATNKFAKILQEFGDTPDQKGVVAFDHEFVERTVKQLASLYVVKGACYATGMGTLADHITGLVADRIFGRPTPKPPRPKTKPPE